MQARSSGADVMQAMDIEVLPAPVWQQRVEAHEQRLGPVLDPYLDRRSRGAKQPVLDFLFQYYSLRPAQLRRWVPGFDQALTGPGSDCFLQEDDYRRRADGSVGLDLASFPEQRLGGLDWVIELLACTASRQPFYGCYGLHEWAMVYRTEQPRHSLPLRLGEEGTNEAVDNHCIRCTHYDAFRFFTPKARPLNQVQPTAEKRHHDEQPGCLHANMDLYRWAYKFHPWTGSDLIADCFVLAHRVRLLDMAASPYDVTTIGLEPIPVETPEGKVTYTRHQKALAEQGAVLRERLLTHLRNLRACLRWFAAS